VFVLEEDDVLVAHLLVEVADEAEPVVPGGAFEEEEHGGLPQRPLQHLALFFLDAVDEHAEVCEVELGVYQGLQLEDLVHFLEDHEYLAVFATAVGHHYSLLTILPLLIVEDDVLLLAMLIQQLEHVVGLRLDRIHIPHHGRIVVRVDVEGIAKVDLLDELTLGLVQLRAAALQ